MPSVTLIVTQIAPISNYLASKDVDEGALFGAQPNPMLPIQIYVETQSCLYRYTYENIAGGSTPSVALNNASNYLYSILGKYGLMATAAISAGGYIPSTGGVGRYSYPIPISYTSLADGTTSFTLSLPVGAILTWVERANTPMFLSEYTFAGNIFTLLGGASLFAGEVMGFQYVTPI